MKQNLMKGRSTIKKAAAWLLTVCLVLTGFAGNVYAADEPEPDADETETYSVLKAKDWLDYDDDGNLIMMGNNQPGYRDETGQVTDEEIEDTDQKYIELPGETLWIDSVTFDETGEEKKEHITFSPDKFTVNYYGEIFPKDENAEVIEQVNDTIKENEKNSNLIDFTPEKSGFYQLSYEGYEGEPLILSVCYPALAFYKEPERKPGNMQVRDYFSNCCDYNYNQEAKENVIYFNLYAEEDSTISLQSGTPEEKEKDEKILTPFELTYWTRDGEKTIYGDHTGIDDCFKVTELTDSEKADNKENINTDRWYKIEFNNPLKAQDYFGEEIYLEGINLHINAEKTDYYYDDIQDEETGEWIRDPNSERSEVNNIDGWLDADCYEYAEDFRYGLVMKNWIYDENGDMILAADGTPGFYDEENNIKPIPEHDYDDGHNLPYTKTVWIDYLTIDGKRTHITADNLMVTYYGERDPYDFSNENTKPETGNANETIKANDRYSDLIDFTPKESGYYLFSVEGLKKPLRVYVDYPSIAFYRDTKLDSLVYDDGSDNYAYCRGVENSIYFYLYDKEDGDWSEKVTLASGDPADEDENSAPFVFWFWDNAGDDIKYGNAEGIVNCFSVKEVEGKDGWYQIIFDEKLQNNGGNINGFQLRINATVENTWTENGDVKTEQNTASSWLNARCFNDGDIYDAAMEAPNLYTPAFTPINPKYIALLIKKVSIEDGKEIETVLNDPSEIKVYIEEDVEGNRQWSKEPVGEDYFKCSVYSEKPDYLQFTFYKQGIYGITDGSGSYIPFDAHLPTLAFYTEPERPSNGRIETLMDTYYEALEWQTDKFYMMALLDETMYCADMDSIKIRAYDENGNDISDQYINCKKIYNENNIQTGYEVELLKEATSNVKIAASGMTVSYIMDEEGNKQPVEQPIAIWNEIRIVRSKLTSIEITTPPSKTVYTEGEEFDASGMAVTAVYANGEKREISSEDYKLSIEGTLSTDDTKVIITYHDKTITQELTVNAKEVQNPPQNTPVITPGSSGGTSSSSSTSSTSNSNTTEVKEEDKVEDNINTPDNTNTLDNTNTPDDTKVPDQTENSDSTQKPDLDNKGDNKNPEEEEPIEVGDSAKDSKTGTYKVTKVEEDGTPVIVYTPNKAAKKASSVTIKATVEINGEKYKVTKIAANALSGNKNLKEVVIPKSITVIGKSAFKNCSKLKNIEIPSRVTTINSSAFKGCSSLKEITIKSSKIKSIGKDSFKNISKKAVIKVPKAKKAAYKKLLKKSGYTGTIK